MPVFDGSPVQVGDRLVDLNEGVVVVLQLFSDSLQMKTASKGTRTYSYEGVLSGRTHKTLFWHHPVVSNPPKDPAVWRAQRELLTTVADVIGPLAPHILQSDEPVNSFEVSSG